MSIDDMNYLTQFITETQINYSSLYKKPINVLSHFLFTIGNVYEFHNGNPIVNVNYNKRISFTEYYKDVKSVEYLLDYYKEYNIDREVENLYKIKKECDERLCEYSIKIGEQCNIDLHKLWQECFGEVNNNLNSIQFLDYDKILDVDYWVEQILDTKYLSLLKISNNYAKIYAINENTEEFLLELSLISIESYLKYYNMFNDELLIKYQYPFGSIIDNNCLLHKEEIYKYVESDVKILTEQKERLQKLR